MEQMRGAPPLTVLATSALCACTLSALGPAPTTTTRCETPAPAASRPGFPVPVTVRCDGPVLDAELDGPFHLDRVDGAELRLVYAPEDEGPHAVRAIVIDARGGRIALELLGRTGRRAPAPTAPRDPSCAAEPTGAIAEALAATGLAHWSMDLGSMASGPRAGWATDRLESTWVERIRRAPHTAGCLGDAIDAPLDRAAVSATPVHDASRAAAWIAGSRSELGAIDAPPGDFAAALLALCAGPCTTEGELDPELADALAPILWASLDAIAAQRALVADAPRGAEWWHRHGGAGLLAAFDGDEGYAPDDAADRAFLERDRGPLTDAAAALALAVETAALARFAGRDLPTYRAETPWGEIRVWGSADDVHAEDLGPGLLTIELGGDDLVLGDAAANRSAAHPVSVHVDLAGDDVYAYPEAAARPRDRLDGRLPADADGRDDSAAGDALSCSRRGRQGSARLGVALAFDLGGDDVYRALRGSQGYAQHGVGVLFDADGDDVYEAESAAQGAAQFGIALALDLGRGTDRRRAFVHAQGFGFSGGLGALYDAAGDDVYDCDVGEPSLGGLPLRPAPQRPAASNASLCQGAALGFRDESPARAMAGGVGLLRDRGGDDVYRASVFAQGSAVWRGLGRLSDHAGRDRYDALQYAQGAAAHFAIGVLADGAGDDQYGRQFPAERVALGAGHDFSIGVLIDETGDDRYGAGVLALGASSCNGFGLFVDGRGDDDYRGSSEHAAGLGNAGECAESRPEAPSVGVMIDAGGQDAYDFPGGAGPSEGGTWGRCAHGLASEHGIGMDRSAEPGVHTGRVPEPASDDG
jgi:hypothetical protein